MRFGCIPDESLAEYHACSAISKTKLDTFRAHPDLYRKIYITKETQRPAPTEAMLFGQRAGCYIMEGEGAFFERYFVVGASKQDALMARLGGKEPVTDKDLQVIRSMAAALRRNEHFVQLTSRGRPEVTFRIPGHHFAVQVRPDWWNDEGCELTDGYPVIVDLKTIKELPQDDDEYLGRHIAEYGYHRSGFLYPQITKEALGWKADLPRPRFFLAFVEKQEPFATEVVEPDEMAVEVGERQVTDSLRKLRRCIETGIWEEPRKGVRKVKLPGYYIRRSVGQTEAYFG